MRMKMHLDTKIGATVILPVYEIDYDVATQTQGYTSIGNGTFGDGSKHNRFKVYNVDAEITDFLDASVPRVMEDNNTNCLFPYRLRYTAELGGHYYPITWFDEGAFTKLETQPDDWWIACKYLKYQTTENTRHLFKPHDPGNTSASFDTFSANNCYTDNNRSFIRKYVTESGAYFVCGQGYAYGGYGSYAIIYPLCMGIGTRMTGSQWSPSNKFFFHDTANNAADIGIAFDGVNSHSSPPYSTGYPLVPVMVHYVKDDYDYYGTALIRWSSFDSDAFPIEITVTGISGKFWDGSIIPGGSGSGSWGSDVVISGGHGTFDAPSDGYGDGDGVYVGQEVTAINNMLSSLFSAGFPYCIYRLGTGDSEHPENFDYAKGVFECLYSDDYWTAWNRENMNPLSAVLSVHLLPSEWLTTHQTSQNLIIGGYNVSTWMQEASYVRYTFDTIKPLGSYYVGKVDLGHYFDAFPDFNPYTTVYLHLPYIGKVQISTNAIMYGIISVSYKVDVISGNIVAYIWCYDKNGAYQVVHTATGNAAYSLPLYSLNQDGSGVGKMITSSLVTIGGVAAMAGASTPIGVVGGALSAIGGLIGTSQGAIDTIAPRTATEISGTLGGNNSLISPYTCWLEIIRPEWVQNKYYQKLHGLPSQMSNTLRQISEEVSVPYDGFVQVEEIDLEPVDCTDSERAEIESLLKRGVYLRGGEI